MIILISKDFCARDGKQRKITNVELLVPGGTVGYSSLSTSPAYSPGIERELGRRKLDDL